MHLSLQHPQTTMNPVYSPASTGVPFTNTKGMGYPGNLGPLSKYPNCKEPLIMICLWFVMLAGFPVGYAAAAAPAYTPNVYAGANPAFPSGKSFHWTELTMTTFLIFGNTDFMCLPITRLCSGHSFQNVLLSQHGDCPTILLLTQPLSSCCVSGPEHLPTTEPLCTGEICLRMALQSKIFRWIFNTHYLIFAAVISFYLFIFNSQQVKVQSLQMPI